MSTYYSESYLPNEVKPNFTAKKKAGLCLSNLNPLKIPVHKIQCYFTVCVIEPVNHRLPYVATNAANLWHLMLMAQSFPFALQV